MWQNCQSRNAPRLSGGDCCGRPNSLVYGRGVAWSKCGPESGRRTGSGLEQVRQEASGAGQGLRFQGVKVLVVEDELLVALNLETLLLEAGCHVIGPIGSLPAALEASESEMADLAILDINLRGEQVFPVAERLLDRGIPLIFCSGYADTSAVPDRFGTCVKLGKPYSAVEITEAMRRVLGAREPDLT